MLIMDVYGLVFNRNLYKNIVEILSNLDIFSTKITKFSERASRR